MVDFDRDFWTLDFEASSLSQSSYPIEVGYCNLFLDVRKSFLIRPAHIWTRFPGGWSEESAKIHGITIEEIYTDGIDPETVCEELNADLDNSAVFVDGGFYDMFWLQRLYDLTDMEPSFHLSYVHYNGKENTKHRALADAIDLWYDVEKSICSPS